MNAVTRLISLNLRSGVAVDEIIDQIKGINCPACNIVKAKGQNIDGLSCPDIISKTIKEFINTDICIPQAIVKEKEPINTGLVCPECGASMIKEAGCVQCLSCGYSKCG
jgi:ribonucleoside-diphosphate reductase alpha chain